MCEKKTEARDTERQRCRVKDAGPKIEGNGSQRHKGEKVLERGQSHREGGTGAGEPEICHRLKEDRDSERDIGVVRRQARDSQRNQRAHLDSLVSVPPL